MNRDRRSLAAQSVLGRIFRDVPFGFVARLWDGTEISLGVDLEPFTLVFRDPATFRRLMLRPNTMRFAEAFVNGKIDVEGDLFSAIRLANRIEALKLGVRDRLSILRQVARLR